MDDEISVINNHLSAVSLTSLPPDDSLCAPPLPHLPVDIVKEILCRLPVKLLLQLRCLYKSWNTIISDPIFAKKHLSHSTTRRIHCLTYSTRRIRSSVTHPESFLLNSYPLDCLFTNDLTTNVTQFEFPSSSSYIVRGNCNGIICFANYYFEGFVLLCNPSLQKFKLLSPLEEPQVSSMVNTSYGFGYDHVNDKYKVVVALCYYLQDSNGNFVRKNEVKLYTLGTDYWKNVGEFPFGQAAVDLSGKFVSGTINWLVSKNPIRGKSDPYFIFSFDLENESYQEVPKPDYGEDVDEYYLVLSVLRDCLCIISEYDIWLMKEYGNRDSWTKLCTVSYMRYPNKEFYLRKAVYIFEDDQVLLDSRGDWNLKLIVYDSRINTFKFTKFQYASCEGSRYFGGPDSPEVCVESLILPWS